MSLFFRKLKEVEVIRTKEQKEKEKREFEEKIKCPLCGAKPNRIYFHDSKYNFYTCSKCDCDYKVLNK